MNIHNLSTKYALFITDLIYKNFERINADLETCQCIRKST